jgi:dUTP pyrophosphatase
MDNRYKNTQKLINNSDKDYQVKKGDRIAQLVLYPLVVVLRNMWTDTITPTDRGSSGFGSTGK